MNDRMRAIAILREAKEILSARLSEQVLESAEEILSDARGESYMNDIETVYEQIGIKLAHVNQMLSNLPAEAEPARDAGESKRDVSGAPSRSEPDSEAKPLIVTDGTAALPGPVYMARPALPAPKPSADVIQLPHKPFEPSAPRSFQTFATEIQAGNLLAAGQSLAALFELEESRAIACAAVFADRLRRDSDFIRRAMQLRSEIEEGGYNQAIVLLYDCFGLSATESITVLQSLRRRLKIEP